jgi:predicted CoA-binding protein
VTPINPRAPSISVPAIKRTGQASEYPTVPSLSALSNPSTFAVSIITPPAVTANVLKEAKELGIKAVWLQPGSYDDTTLKFAREEFEGGVGGKEGLNDTAGEEGWCVLVDGEQGLKKAGRVPPGGGRL